MSVPDSSLSTTRATRCGCRTRSGEAVRIATVVLLATCVGAASRPNMAAATVEHGKGRPGWIKVVMPEIVAEVPGNWCQVDLGLATTKGIPRCVRESPPKGGATRVQVSTIVTMFSPLSGDFLLLERDPLGAGVDFDAIWEAEVRDGTIRLTTEEWCEPSTDRLREWCTRGDGRLDIWVGSKLLKFGEHRYFVKIGNLRKEQGVDMTVLRSILESVQMVQPPPR